MTHSEFEEFIESKKYDEQLLSRELLAEIMIYKANNIKSHVPADVFLQVAHYLNN